MDIKILRHYLLKCKNHNIEPTWHGLKQYEFTWIDRSQIIVNGKFEYNNKK